MDMWFLQFLIPVMLMASSIYSFPVFPVASQSNRSTGIYGDLWESAADILSNSRDPPNSPLNLTVTVELSTRDQIELSSLPPDPVANKRLKLVIRWLHPTAGEPPEGYNVEVRPSIPSSYSIGDWQLCTEHFADFFHHVEYNSSELPTIEIGSGTTKGEHLVQFGCSYYVSVQASPIIPPARSQVFNITVPDCVDGVCRCSSRPRLPKPEELTAHAITTSSGLHDDRSFLVLWSYPSSKEALDISLIVRIERAENVLGLGPVYRKVREYRHKAEPGPNRFQQAVHHIESHSSYRVRVAAYDSHHCEGQIAEIYLNRDLKLDERSRNLHQETLVSTVVLGLIFLAATALIIALSWRRFLRRLHLMASAAAAGNATSARYSRSPNIFHRDNRRGTTLLTNGSNSTCQNLMNALHADREAEEPRHLLLGSNKAIDDYEIDPALLKLGVEIGKGAFGRVHLATVENLPGQPGPSLVAVKQMKKKIGLNERDDFLAEIAMMKRVGRHENIVVMLACVTLNQPYSMILEYVPYGDLLHYLRTLRAVYHQFKGWVNDKGQQHPEELSVGGSSSSVALLPRKLVTHSTSDNSKSYHLSHIFSSVSSQSTGSSHSSSSYVIPNYYRGFLKAFPTSRTINTEELHDFARQIARGMEHLELKGITHRDLAARNLLVSEGRILKISDFGLSRHGVYVNTRTRMLPLRWLAIESMTDNLYSSLSDVWAFGVVLWEICTLGGFPYANVSDAQLMTYLLSGNRLARPDNVSEKLYQLMLKCWSANPDDRPTFHQLRCSLEDFEAHHETYVDFSYSVSSTVHTLPPTEEEVVVS